MFLRTALSLLFLASGASCAQIPPKDSTAPSESLVVVPPFWASHSRAGDKAWQLLLPVYLQLQEPGKTVFHSIPWSQSRSEDGKLIAFAIGAGLWCSYFDKATTGHYAGFGAIGAEWNDKGLSWRLPPLISRSKSSSSGFWDKLCLYNDEYSQSTFLLGSTFEPVSIPNYRQQISPLFHQEFDATSSICAFWPFYSCTSHSDDEGFLGGMFSLVSIRDHQRKADWDPLTGLLYQEKKGTGYKSWNSLFNYGQESFPLLAERLIMQGRCDKNSRLDTWFWDERKEQHFTRLGEPVLLLDDERAALLAWIGILSGLTQPANPRPTAALKKLGFDTLPDDENEARFQVRQALEKDIRLDGELKEKWFHLPLLEIPLWEESSYVDYGFFKAHEARLDNRTREVLWGSLYFHKESEGETETRFLGGLLEFSDNTKTDKRGGKVFWIPWGD